MSQVRIQDRLQKEDEIMDIIAGMSSWWHKWEEDRNGKTVVCIEYHPDIIDTKQVVLADYEIE